MEDKEKQEFIDGFNKGYLIRKYRKDMHEKLSNSLNDLSQDNPLVQGMVKGGEEAELEQKSREFGDLRRRDDRDLERE